MRRAGAERALRAVSLLAVLGIWQLAARWADPRLLPAPTVVLAALGEQVASGALLYHLGATLARVAASFAVAMLVGAAIGILMGRAWWADTALDGALILGLNIPALVTAILCYIWFGLGELAAVVAVALNKIPTVVVTLREGARAVDTGLLEVGTVFGVPRGRVLVRIYLPQLYPYVMAAARSGLALIWKIVLVVELIGRSSGIGFQLGIFFNFFDITRILAYTLAFAGTVLVIEEAGLRPLERSLTRWRA